MVEDDPNSKWFFIGVAVTLILWMFVAVIIQEIDMRDIASDYCKTNNYTGVIAKGIFYSYRYADDNLKCYKKVNDISGIGREEVYSGRFTMDDIQ